jgi:hypothetical protein
MNKSIIGAVALVLVGFAVGYGVFGNKVTVIEQIGQAVSVAGVTNSTARLASVVAAPPTTATATTTSLYNGDGVDRAITDAFAYCTGVGTSRTYLTGAGLAALTVQMSTSTIAGDAKRNTNYPATFTVATSSAWAWENYLGTSATDMNLVWPSATYLNITFNATNTAACTIGVHYLSL